MWLFLADNPYKGIINATSIGVNSGTSDLPAAMAAIVVILMSVIGGLSIVFIIVGGVQMAVSSGNPTLVSKARHTILYALIGLVIAIAALAIVNFVTSSVVPPPPPPPTP